MKIRVVLTVEVDPQAWKDEYGNDNVREDVRTYALNAVQQSSGMIETDASVSLA